MATNVQPKRPKNRRGKFDTSSLKRTLVVSGVLATLVGGEMIAGQELFESTPDVIVPELIPAAQVPIDHETWLATQKPLTQLVVPDAVTSNLPIVDGQLLVGGEPVIELVVPDLSSAGNVAVDTSSLVGDAPIVELVVPNPVAVPAGSAGAIDLGNSPLVSLTVPENNGGGNVPAPTTTSKSSK